MRLTTRLRKRVKNPELLIRKGKKIIATQEMALKIAAAREGLNEPGFVTSARAGAAAVGELEGAVARGKAYLEPR